MDSFVSHLLSFGCGFFTKLLVDLVVEEHCLIHDYQKVEPLKEIVVDDMSETTFPQFVTLLHPVTLDTQALKDLSWNYLSFDKQKVVLSLSSKEPDFELVPHEATITITAALVQDAEIYTIFPELENQVDNIQEF